MYGVEAAAGAAGAAADGGCADVLWPLPPDDQSLLLLVEVTGFAGDGDPQSQSEFVDEGAEVAAAAAEGGFVAP